MEVDTVNIKKLSEMLHKIDNSIQSENVDEKLVKMTGATFETILGQDWWISAKRLTLGNVMQGTGFRLRYETVSRSCSVRTNLGRGRLLLKHLLDLQILSKVIHAFICLGMFPVTTFLGHKDYQQRLLQFSKKIDRVTWSCLHLDDAEWLDLSWDQPTQVTHELVPSCDLGVSVTLLEGWPLVTHVQESSVAGEDGKVEVGDVILQINGVNVVGSKTVEKLLNLISKGKRLPMKIKVTKCFDHKSAELFPPLIPFLKSVKIDVEELQRRNYLTKRSVRNNSDDVDEEFNPLEDSDDESSERRTGHSCLYLGSVNVGSSGDFDRIEFGITRVLNCIHDTRNHVSNLQIADMDVRLYNQETDQLILRF